MIPGFALLIIAAGMVRPDWVQRRLALGIGGLFLVVAALAPVLGLMDSGRGWRRFVAWVDALSLLALVVAILVAFWPEDWLLIELRSGRKKKTRRRSATTRKRPARKRTGPQD